MVWYVVHLQKVWLEDDVARWAVGSFFKSEPKLYA